MKSRILFISAHRQDARRLSEMLHALPLQLHHAPSLNKARTRLHQQTYNVILTEAALPDGKWLDVLDLARDCPRRDRGDRHRSPGRRPFLGGSAESWALTTCWRSPSTNLRFAASCINVCSRSSRCRPWPPYNGFSTHGETMSAATDAFVKQNQSRLLEELKEFLRIPSISTLPENRADVERAANFVADALRTAGHGERRADSTDKHPLVYADWLHAPGKPTVSLLRPLRCAAGRSAGTVDISALRTHRARRQPLRARHGRRQGPDVLAHQGHRGAARGQRHAAGQI